MTQEDFWLPIGLIKIALGIFLESGKGLDFLSLNKISDKDQKLVDVSLSLSLCNLGNDSSCNLRRLSLGSFSFERLNFSRTVETSQYPVNGLKGSWF